MVSDVVSKLNHVCEQRIYNAVKNSSLRKHIPDTWVKFSGKFTLNIVNTLTGNEL